MEELVQGETGMAVEKASALTLPAKSRLVVIGIGNIGMKALGGVSQEYDPYENPHLGMMAIEPNLSMLDSCFKVAKAKTKEGEQEGHPEKWLGCKDRIIKVQLGTDGLGAGGNPEVGKALAKEEKKLAEIKSGFANYDHGVIIAGGGGGSGGAAEVVAEALLEAGKTCYALITTPRAMEGEDKLTKALVLLKRMLELCPTLGIQNEMIPDKKLTFSKAFTQINEHSLFRVLWMLKAILLNRGNVIDHDGNDWRNGTLVGNHTMAGFFDAVRGFDGLESDLLENPYLEPKNLWKAGRVIYCAEGEWPVEDCERVDACVKKRMRNGGHDKGVEFKWCIRDEEGGVPKGTKTIGLVSFAKEGPDVPDADEKRAVAINIPLELGKQPMVLPGIEAPALPHTEEIHIGTNGFPTPPTAEADNGDDSTVSVPLEVVVNHKGEKELIYASPELAERYKRLAMFAKNPTRELCSAAISLRAELERETGINIYIPADLARLGAVK